MKRRDLLQLMGSSVVGASLAGCSDVVGPGEYDLPDLANAFRFYPIKSSGDTLPGGGQARRLRLDCAIGGDRVVYGAFDSDHDSGLYAVDLDFSSGVPRITGEARIVHMGDALENGRTVRRVGAYDMNTHGGLAVILTRRDTPDEDGVGIAWDAIYYSQAGEPLAPLIEHDMVTPDGHRLVGLITDVDIHTGHDTLFVAEYYDVDPFPGEIRDARDPEPALARQGLFHMLGADVGTLELVLHQGDLTASQGHMGLVDMHDDGSFVLQATPGVTLDGPAGAPGPTTSAGSGGFLVEGRVGSRALQTVTRPTAAVGPLPIPMLGGAALGEPILGPRTGPGDYTAYVLHESAASMTLYYHSHRLLSTGERSPGGSTVLSIAPPAFGTEGQLFYGLITRDGHELCATNGDETRLLLRSGDRLENDPRVVDSILMGDTTEHVDAAGRLVFTTTFTDGSAAVVVGIPL